MSRTNTALEYRGLHCALHGMGAFTRERGSVEPWSCAECIAFAAHPHVLAEMASALERAPADSFIRPVAGVVSGLADVRPLLDAIDNACALHDGHGVAIKFEAWTAITSAREALGGK